MSISPLTGPERLRAAQANAQRTKSAAAPPASTPAREPDSIALSESALALRAAQSSVGTSDGVRLDRVAAVRAALAAGTYTIDSQQLARAIVAHDPD
jgi:negative regulator of flagellin synthesis FlgM